MGNNLKSFIFICTNGTTHRDEVIEDIVMVVTVDKIIPIFGVYDIIVELSGPQDTIIKKRMLIGKIHNVQSMLLLNAIEEYNV